LVAIVLAASVATSAANEPPYEINVILPLTGYGAFLGKEEQIALHVIEDRVNKSGGIRGRQIRFAIADTQSNPQVAVQLANAIIAKNAPFFLGSTIVADCNATGPLLKSGPVEFCFSPGIHPASGSYLFSTGASTSDLIAATARYIRGRGWKRVALITSTDASGQDGEKNVDLVFAKPENSSISVVAKEHFNTSDVSVAAQMADIKASGAQVLIAWTTGSGFGTVLHGVADAGLTIPVSTTNGNLTYAQMRSYAHMLPKELYFAGVPSLAPESLPSGSLKNVVADYHAAFKDAGVSPDMGMNQAWDPALLLVDVLKKLGFTATPKSIHDYLEGLQGWTGVNGTYDFKAIPQRGVGIASVPMLQWDAQRETWVGVSRLGGEPLR
jgi:branched-chain amino acid transport system substrate-binding protein